MTNDHLRWLQQIGNCAYCQRPIIRNHANDNYTIGCIISIAVVSGYFVGRIGRKR